MELEELSRRVAEQARQLQSDLEDLHGVADVRRMARSTEPVGSVLDRIERRLTVVNDHTDQLLGRVPESLGLLLAEIKDVLLDRLASASQGPTRSSQARRSQTSPPGRLSLKDAIAALTPTEQKVFRICFDGGLLTYRAIAERLDVAPTTAKNIVNRLFKDSDKRRLFQKRQVHGIAQVTLNEEVQKQILNGRENQCRKSGPLTDQDATLPDHP